MVVSVFDRKVLKPADLQRGSKRRLLALWSLRVLSILAALATPLASILWYLTAVACWETYIRRSTPSVVLHPDSAQSTLQFLICLDLSTAAALVVFLLCFFLAKNGLRNSFLVPASEGENFRERAYSYQLFPDNLADRCVQLGLIGTLLSFVLAALTMIADVQGMRTPGATVEATARTEVEPGAGTGQDTGPVNHQQARRSAESSQRIFLLLCACLTGALVGSFVAYLVLPPLERLNACALGRHQLPSLGSDPDENMRELAGHMKVVCGALDTTAGQLTHFGRVLDGAEQLTMRVEGAHQALTGLGTGLGIAQAALTSLSDNASAAAGSLRDTTAQLQASAAKLDGNAARLESNCLLLEHLPALLGGPVEELTSGARAVGAMAKAAEGAQRNLADLALYIREPLGLLGQAVHGALDIVHRVYEAIRTLVEGEKQQREGIAQMAVSFQKLEEYLKSLVAEVHRLVREGQTGQAEIVGRLDDLTARPSSSDEMRAIERHLNHLDETVSQLARDLRAEQETSKHDYEKVAAQLGDMESRWDKMLRQVRRGPSDRPRHWLWRLCGRRPGRNGPIESPLPRPAGEAPEEGSR